MTAVRDLAEKRHAIKEMIQKNERKLEMVIAEQITDESLARVTIGHIDIEYMSGKRSDSVVVSL